MSPTSKDCERARELLAEADLAFVNLESPFSDKGAVMQRGMIFKTEPEMNAGLDLAGIDSVVLERRSREYVLARVRDCWASAFAEKALLYRLSQGIDPLDVSVVVGVQRMVFGEYGGSRSPRAEALFAALKRTGIDAEISADIRRTLWEKYVFLVGLSGSTASMRRTLGPVRSNPQTRAFLLDLMRETVAVGRALGVNLPADYADQRLAFADTLSPEMTSSLHHDLEHGNSLEVEWLSGGVVTLGKKAGVPTPCNRAVWDVLALYADGRPRAA